MDADFTAGHVHGDVFVAETDPVRDGSGGTAAGAGSERVTGTPFPDFDLNIVAVDHFEELDVGSVGELWVHLDGCAIRLCYVGADFVADEDAMRVADVGCVNSFGLAVESQRLPQILIGLLGAIERDVIHPKAHSPHVDGDGLGPIRDLTGDDSAGGIDREGIVFDSACIVEVACKNTQPITAFLGLAPVGIHYPEAKVGFFRYKWAAEDTVGSQAEIAVADADNGVGFGELSAVFWVEDQIIVSECVVF